MSEWKTIDSAPKDGTIVLVWPKSGSVPTPAIWSRPWFHYALAAAFIDVGSGWVSLRADSYSTGKGWDVTWTEHTRLVLLTEPTHWMPLPPPPAER